MKIAQTKTHACLCCRRTFRAPSKDGPSKVAFTFPHPAKRPHRYPITRFSWKMGDAFRFRAKCAKMASRIGKSRTPVVCLGRWEGEFQKQTLNFTPLARYVSKKKTHKPRCAGFWNYSWWKYSQLPVWSTAARRWRSDRLWLALFILDASKTYKGSLKCLALKMTRCIWYKCRWWMKWR